MNEQIDEILDDFGHAAVNEVERRGADFKEAKAKLQRLMVEAKIDQQRENYRGLVTIGVAKQPGEGKYDSVRRYLETSIAQLTQGLEKHEN